MSEQKRHHRGHNEGSIRKRADGIYEARVTVGRDLLTGKAIRKSFYSKDRKVVKAIMDKALQELKTNGYISQSHSYTVGEWLKHWLVTYKLPDTASSTVHNLKNIIENYLSPIHKIKLDKLRPIEVQQVYNSIDISKSTRMVEATHSCLNNAYKYAIKLGYVNYNPAQATFLPKKKSQSIKALDREQQSAFLKVLEASPDKNLLLFYLLTGLRRGELIALKWENINYEKGVINITGAAVRHKDFHTGEVEQIKSKTKTAAGVRKLPLFPALKDILCAQQEARSGEYIFSTDKGSMLSLDVPDKAFRTVCEQAQLEGFTLHSLRHTFATRVYESGVKDKVNQALMGHASDSVTKEIYIHANEDFVMEEAKKITIIK